MSGPAGGEAFRRIARRYFRAALFYLALGLLLGAGMLWFGNDNLQFLHSHMLLVGVGLFGVYGAGLWWIAGRSDAGPIPGITPALATAQFWLASVGLVGMLAGSVLPIGLGLDRIGVLFGFVEAFAGVLFTILVARALKPQGSMPCQ
ncbi:MAG TPA: hypothetical protein VMV30_00240 [Candidatus Lokiarchaeia archaeon]|nr:hypothetical protein [Candidatus Lokiarchaeia archaeon]